MRPNTSASGIFSTKRNSPVSTSMLTRMLVPKPKNAFQSPGVQIAGLNSPLLSHVVLIVTPPLRIVWKCPVASAVDDIAPELRNPAENAALRLDHPQAHLVEFGKVGAQQSASTMQR